MEKEISFKISLYYVFTSKLQFCVRAEFFQIFFSCGLTDSEGKFRSA